MLRNYFKTAVRNLVRHRFFSAINIFGLSLAMSVCMAIIMLVADQLQYDRYNSKRDRVFRVNSIHIEKSTGLAAPDAIVSSTSPMPLKEELEKFTGTDQVVRFKRGFGNGWIEFENQDINVPLAGYFADQGVLQMFEYELQYGDANTALKEPYSVVLTRKAADKLFSDENPVGKTLKVGELGLYTVTGVLKKTEKKTHIAFEAPDEHEFGAVTRKSEVDGVGRTRLVKFLDHVDVRSTQAVRFARRSAKGTRTRL